MATNEKLPHLLAYDISNPRRLYRVAKIAAGWGLRVQYSLFILWISPAERVQLLDELGTVINPATDDIRLYPLPQKAKWTHIGRTPLATGATLYANGVTVSDKQQIADIRKNPELPLQGIDFDGK